jgi:3-oxoacyl-(acyl-carrier-protein) synthase
MRRICITRALASTPRGRLTVEGFGLDPSPMRLVRRFRVDDFPIKYAAEIDGDDQCTLTLSLIEETLQAHSLSQKKQQRLGVFVGAEPERVKLDALSKAQSATFDRAVLHSAAYDERSPARLTNLLKARYQESGPSGTFSMACAASASAISNAFYSMRRGDCDAALCVGAALNVEPLLFAGFCLLRAMSASGKCQPFSQHRDGFILGDGIGCLLLEAEDLVQREGRTAEILGYLEGAGESLDAYRITDPEPTGKGAKDAIRRAFQSAHREANEVSLVKAHATGTIQNDRVEASVIAELFTHEPPVLAVKGGIGHSIAACGLVELIAALSSLRKQSVEHCFGLESFDEALSKINVSAWRADGINQRPISGNLALCNTFGFGGINCALLISARD